MDKEKILGLAKLARIDLKDAEAESLSGEFEAILNYISEVKKAAVGGESRAKDKKDFSLKNVLRKDQSPHETGLYTEKILKEAPKRNANYIKVKKIL